MTAVPAPQTAGPKKVLYVATIANLVIAASKFTAAALTGSSAMVAEGIHSIVDTGNELLLLLGNRRATRPADEAHPFGYGKVLYFWGLMAAVWMFVLGGGTSVYKGVIDVMHPPVLGSALWNYVVLSVAAVFEAVSWWVSRKELFGRRLSRRTAWERVQASKDPSVFMVFIEDSAALIGIGLAFTGVAVGHALDNPYADPIASIAIGVLMLIAAAVLARETGALLVGEGMDGRYIEEFERVLSEDPSVRWVGDILTMQLSPAEVLLTAEIGFDNGLDTRGVVDAIERLKRTVRTRHPTVTRMYFEPRRDAAARNA